MTLAYSRAQTVNDIYTAFENIYPVLQEFRVASSEPQPTAEPDDDLDAMDALVEANAVSRDLRS